MLSVVHTYNPPFFLNYEEFDYPRPLLNEEYRDMRHGYWNVRVNSWKKFNKSGAMFWVHFIYEH